MLEMKKILLLTLFAQCTPPLSLYATATMECHWKATNFEARSMRNYGNYLGSEKIFKQNIVEECRVIIRLDSLLNHLRRAGRVTAEKRWILYDHYIRGRKTHGNEICGDTVYLCLTDPVSVNSALRELWGITDHSLSPSPVSAKWLFSLHIGTFASRDAAWAVLDRSRLSRGSRPDKDLLWLTVEGDWSSSHSFIQHETDGYWHLYTGLYSTKNNALKAAKVWQEILGRKVVLVSQYLTPNIIGQYLLLSEVRD